MNSVQVFVPKTVAPFALRQPLLFAQPIAVFRCLKPGYAKHRAIPGRRPLLGFGPVGWIKALVFRQRHRLHCQSERPTDAPLVLIFIWPAPGFSRRRSDHELHRAGDQVAVHNGVDGVCTMESARTRTFTNGSALAIPAMVFSQSSPRRRSAPGSGEGCSRRRSTCRFPGPYEPCTCRLGPPALSPRSNSPATTTTAPHHPETTPTPPPPDTRRPIALVDGTSPAPSRSVRTSGCRARSESPA
jgi:hypothetical protein